MNRNDFCLLLALNPLVHDSRMLRLASYFRSCGRFSRVLVLGLCERGDSENFQDWPAEVFRASRPLPTLGQPLARAGLSAFSFLRLALKVARQLRGQKGWIWAADADGLAFGWLLSRLLGSPLIYDAHEFWPAESGRRGMGTVLRWLEKTLITRASALTTVSDAIAEAYLAHYALPSPPEVILNTPVPKDPGEPVIDLRLPGVQTLLYQGHLVADRRLLEFIQAFRSREPGPPMRLAFLGHGPLLKQLQAMQGPDLVVYPSVRPQQLLAVTQTASAGLVLLDPRNQNHQLTLTNKLFEYLQAGIPILATDCCPEMTRILSHYQLGTVFADDSPDSVQAALRELQRWLAPQGSSPSRSVEAQRTFAWCHQEVKLNQLLRRVLDFEFAGPDASTRGPEELEGCLTLQRTSRKKSI